MGAFRQSPTGKMEVFILFPYTMGKLSTEKQTYPQGVKTCCRLSLSKSPF